MYTRENFKCVDGMYYVGDVIDADGNPWVEEHELDEIIADLNQPKPMTKKEIRSAINKAAYEFAQSLGYQVSDVNDGSYVTFSRDGNGDNTIDWSRSYHETCVLNWADAQTQADAQAIDDYMKPIIEHYNNQYGAKH